MPRKGEEEEIKKKKVFKEIDLKGIEDGELGTERAMHQTRIPLATKIGNCALVVVVVVVVDRKSDDDDMMDALRDRLVPID